MEKFFLANDKGTYDKAVANLKKLGFVWASDFGNVDIPFEKAKSFYRGNAKIYIHCFHNPLTNKHEMQITTKTHIDRNLANLKAIKPWIKYSLVQTDYGFYIKETEKK